MKTAARVFLVFGILSGIGAIISALTFNSLMATLLPQLVAEAPELSMIEPYITPITIVLGILGAVQIILAIVSIVMTAKAKTTTPLKILGVFDLFFVNLLAGIFMLCIKEESLN
ncbi:MAG: hypothetical protein ACI4MS_04115 [Candidatus Coproplasma sp.]